MKQLREKYQWPDEKPGMQKSDHGWFDNEEKVEAYKKILLEKKPQIILEIGSWFGKSTKIPLSILDDVTIICIDPWNKDGDIEENYKYNLPAKVRDNLNSIYEIFLVNCWDYRSSIIPMREKASVAVKIIKDYGIEPDLILIDGDHSYEMVRKDIEDCYDLFPGAILVGDDYNWVKNGKTPVRDALSDFCKERSEKVDVFGSLWVMRRGGFYE